MNDIIKFKLLFICLLFCSMYCYSQKASISVRLFDSSYKDPSEYNFLVKVKNIAFEKYWIQDTSVINELLKYTGQSPIYPFLSKKEATGFVTVDPEINYHGTLADSLELYCTKCVTLLKGDSIVLKLRLLRNYKLSPGTYQIQTATHPPIMSCNGCEQLQEIFSNNCVFEVHNKN